MVVVRLLGFTVTNLWFVAVFVRGVVPDDSRQQLELLLHGVVNPSLNRAHHLQHALKDSQRRTNRGLGRGITDLQVSHGSKAPTVLDDLVHQPNQDLARLLVRQRQDVVAHRARGQIYVTELTGGDGGVVALDPQATGFQTTGQVGQRSRIHQLAHQGSCCFGVATDQVDQTE